MRKDREEKEKKKRVKMGNNQRPKGRLEWGKRGCGRDGAKILRGQSKDCQKEEGVFRAQ